MDYEMMMRERESDFMLDAREQMIELHTSLFMILVFTLKNFSVCKRPWAQIMMTLVSTAPANVRHT